MRKEKWSDTIKAALSCGKAVFKCGIGLHQRVHTIRSGQLAAHKTAAAVDSKLRKKA